MPNPFTPEQIAQILEAFFETVGTRQYIGARYVPLFGRKNEDSIIWDNTAPYEQLTVVLYQGNSYTSRQYVPAGVDITDQSFWAITGNYNAQVEQYRQEVASFDARITANADAIANEIIAREDAIEDEATAREDAIEAETTARESAIDSINTQLKGSILIIGDSYSEGYTPDGTVTSWSQMLKTQLESKYQNINVYIYHTGGYGFGNGGFTTLATNAANNMTEEQRDSIGTVIIGGGYNDWNQSYANVKLGMTNVATILTTSFKNVKKKIILDFGRGVWTLTTGVHTSYNDYTKLNQHKQLCLDAASCGYACPFNAFYQLTSKTLFSSDYVHPNQTGQNMIMDYVMCCLFGVGSFDYVLQDDIRVNNTTIGVRSYQNGITKVTPSVYKYIFEPDNVGITANGQQGIELGTCTPSIALPPFSSIYLQTVASIKHGEEYTVSNGLLQFTPSDGVYLLKFYPLVVVGTSFKVFTNINRVEIMIPSFYVNTVH